MLTGREYSLKLIQEFYKNLIFAIIKTWQDDEGLAMM